MTCLNEARIWVARSQVLSEKGGLQHQENDNAAENSASKLMNDQLENIFPLYAVGITEPHMNLVASVVNSGCNGIDPIWDTIREEAKLEAVREPILSSYLHANILAHGCLEGALAFILANRLHNATLLARHVVDILSDVIMHDRDVQRAIRLDIQALKDRDPTCSSYCSALLNFKGYHSLETQRVAHSLWNQGSKLLASALQSRVSEVFGVDIHPAAKIGEGILLEHATGVVIGETAVVGNRVSLMQGVTLGGTGKETGDRHPKVGQGALIGARVTILGNIKIGEGAMIASGSLVLKDVPPHSMVAGIPAKLIGYVTEQDASLTMNHDASKRFCEHLEISSNEHGSTGALGPK